MLITLKGARVNHGAEPAVIQDGSTYRILAAILKHLATSQAMIYIGFEDFPLSG